MVDLQKNHPFEPEHTQEVPEELFAEIGCRLVLLQDLEMFIAYVSKVVFAENAQKAKEAILNADTMTLGQLMGLLRKNVEIEESFDECLKRTLGARNLFVHEFSHEFNIHTEAGAKEAIKFLVDTMDDLEESMQVMKAVIVSFGRSRSVEDKELEDYWRKHGDLSQLELKYIPRASKSLKKKTP
ncbi:hypothetical protein [Geothrix sp.]|jgi:hypothetical protein|uniref:hypothetical protein n=1 Tax=Geothrix sp. TaxID=1962974 RepID=UPI0025C49C39|nr:hypothetical protein [Geothrix sp.]